MALVRALLLFVICSSAFALSQKPQCLSYEPTVVALRGRVIKKTFAGPPNYENVGKGDRPETEWILNLDSPVCMNADPTSDSNNGDQQGVRSAQLVFLDHTMYKRYATLVNKKVIAKGTLFAAITGHHHLPLLLTVTDLKPSAK